MISILYIPFLNKQQPKMNVLNVFLTRNSSRTSFSGSTVFSPQSKKCRNRNHGGRELFGETGLCFDRQLLTNSIMSCTCRNWNYMLIWKVLYNSCHIHAKSDVSNVFFGCTANYEQPQVKLLSAPGVGSIPIYWLYGYVPLFRSWFSDNPV